MTVFDYSVLLDRNVVLSLIDHFVVAVVVAAAADDDDCRCYRLLVVFFDPFCGCWDFDHHGFSHGDDLDGCAYLDIDQDHDCNFFGYIPEFENVRRQSVGQRRCSIGHLCFVYHCSATIPIQPQKHVFGSVMLLCI